MNMPQFAHSYIAPPPSPTIGGQEVHGPFVLAALSADHFVPRSSIEAQSRIDDYVRSRDPEARLADLGLEQVPGLPLDGSEVVFELVAPNECQHALADLIADYSDLVILDREKQLLTEVVMGYD
jgi:hypothetical protein